MEKFKGTPAPWNVVRTKDNRRLGIIAANELVIVTHTFDGSEAEINMNLIAAAPELLEALRELVVSAHSISMEHQDARVKAINAIHKELGQTNKEAEP